MSKGADYRRRLSSAERLYLAADIAADQTKRSLTAPFSIQILIEAEGIIEPARLRDAIVKASDANPGCRLTLSGHLNRSQWVDSGIPPRLVEIEGMWDDTCFENNSHITRPLDPRHGPTSEVLLFKGIASEPRSKLLFRSLHATMDGRGALTWIEDVFRILRGYPPKGSLDNLTDRELALTLGKTAYRPNYSLNAGSPFDSADRRLNTGSFKNRVKENERGFSWQRRRLDGTYPGLVARIAEILTVQLPDDGSVARFMIPVDLRRHGFNHSSGSERDSEIRSTANLSNPLYIEVTRGSAWQDIYQSIIEKLQHNDDGIVGRWDDLLRFVPNKLSACLLKTLVRLQEKQGRYLLTAVISHLGKIDLADFSCPGFTATSMSFLPVNNPLSPATLIMAEFDDHTDITIASPNSCAGVLDQQRLLSLIESALQPDNKTRTVVDLINDTIATYPDRIALKTAAEQLTYRELERRVGQPARTLQHKGVKPGDTVALCLPRSVDFIVSLLAVLRLGAAYLPIEPDLPEQRIQAILDDAQAAFIILLNDHIGQYKTDCEQACVVELLNYPLHQSTERVLAKLNKDALAYVIYTSGTTGKPKGVEIGHQNLLNYLLWAQQVYTAQKANEEPVSRNAALFTSVSFDLTVTSIFLPLICGGTVNIYGDITNSLVLKQIIEDPENHIVKLTPSHLKLLQSLDTGLKVESQIKTAREKDAECCMTRVFIVGGEAFPTYLAKWLDELNPGKNLIFNEYGPTECTVGCVLYQYDPLAENDTTLLIGKPAANTRVYLLDGQHQPVPPGQVGEIYISGDGVARGYLRNQELTDDRFLLDPFNSGCRMYRSGDIGKLVKDGNIAYLGRVDEQVKINGYRIEPGDIESVLMQHKLIENCVVLAAEQPIGEPRLDGQRTRQILVGFYVRKAGAGSSAMSDIAHTEFRSHLKLSLPDYMVPAKFVSVDTIPLTVNGKVDKAQLMKEAELSPAVYTQKPDFKVQSRQDEGDNCEETEQKLRRIWLNLFSLEQIEPQVSFFALGGDSLLLVHLLSQIIDTILSPDDAGKLFEKTAPILDNLTYEHIRAVVLNIEQRG